MKTTDFDYELPQELIAQAPMEPRDHSRLMVLHRDTGAIDSIIATFIGTRFSVTIATIIIIHENKN